MKREVAIIVGDDLTLSAAALAVLDDNATARAIWDILPIGGNVNLWGDSFTLHAPIEVDFAEDACVDVALGTLAYWPPDNTLFIFFGPTPASQGNQIRAASPVNPIGKIQGDCSRFKLMETGWPISIRQA